MPASLGQVLCATELNARSAGALTEPPAERLRATCTTCRMPPKSASRAKSSRAEAHQGCSIPRLTDADRRWVAAAIRAARHARHGLPRLGRHGCVRESAARHAQHGSPRLGRHGYVCVRCSAACCIGAAAATPARRFSPMLCRESFRLGDRVLRCRTSSPCKPAKRRSRQGIRGSSCSCLPLIQSCGTRQHAGAELARHSPACTGGWPLAPAPTRAGPPPSAAAGSAARTLPPPSGVGPPHKHAPHGLREKQASARPPGDSRMHSRAGGAAS